MKGFMRQRGDAWELRAYLGRDPVTGKQRYASRTVRAGKRAAQRALANMVTDAERACPCAPTPPRGFIDRNALLEIGAVPLTS